MLSIINLPCWMLNNFIFQEIFLDFLLQYSYLVMVLSFRALLFRFVSWVQRSIYIREICFPLLRKGRSERGSQCPINHGIFQSGCRWEAASQPCWEPGTAPLTLSGSFYCSLWILVSRLSDLPFQLRGSAGLCLESPSLWHSLDSLEATSRGSHRAHLISLCLSRFTALCCWHLKNHCFICFV